MENFSKSHRKLNYTYVLTPNGIAGKGAIKHFLRRKFMEFEALKTEIAPRHTKAEETLK